MLGWGEFELEVMRDRNDNVVIICSIENIDPMGVHTGDSVTVAPAQTLTDPLYQELRDQAIKVIRAVGVETGGSNVQFAVNPETGEIVVIEMNPRVSRSSALASKATGFPIAKIAAKLAVGYALEEIPNDITGRHAGLVRADDRLRRHQDPALRLREVPRRRGRADHAHEVGRRGDGDRPHLPRVLREGDALARARLAEPSCPPTTDELLERLETPRADRFDLIARGVPARGRPSRRSTSATTIDPWFLRELEALATEGDGTEGLERTFHSVDTCAAEFEARTPYFYSAHERKAPLAGEVRRGDRESVVILGSGPNRIGQGIEFDYCCVHAAMTVRESGRDAVMINCNPETVSTDYDTSDRLYFEPLTAEDVLAVIEVEQPEGVIVQFGGQTPLRLAKALEEAGVTLLGTPGRRDRPRRGPRPLRRAAAPARDRPPALRHRALGRGGADDRRGRRLPAAGPALLRARRPGDGDLLLGRGPRRRTSSATSRPTRSTRCCSTASSRTRSRSTSTRSATATTCEVAGDHAARRGGRRALRRLGLRDPADEPRRGDARRDPRDDARGSRSSSA